MKNMLQIFKRKWCVVDLSYVGGGYIGQTYTVKYPEDVFDKFQIASIELPHFAKAGYITSMAIKSRFYSKEKALTKINRLIYGSLLHSLLHNQPIQESRLLALCAISVNPDGEETITIKHIDYTKIGNHSIDYLYTVVDFKLSYFSPEPPVHNLWISVAIANRYKECLGSSDAEASLHTTECPRYAVRPYH